MKKLMIAAALVCAAVCAQAATTKWSANTGTTKVTYDGYKNTGSGYTATAVSGATYYLICVSTDSVGEPAVNYGISQSDLLKAFRDNTATFNLADYKVRSSGSGTTTSAGKMPTLAGVQTFSNTEDFTATQYYDFYLATVVTDGDNKYLYMTDTLNKAALASTSTQAMSFDPSASSKVNLGSGAYSTAGWYAAVPEPTSGLLLLLGMAGLALKRKRA